MKKVKSMSLKSLRAEGLVRIYLREKEREDVLFGRRKTRDVRKGRNLKVAKVENPNVYVMMMMMRMMMMMMMMMRRRRRRGGGGW